MKVDILVVGAGPAGSSAARAAAAQKVRVLFIDKKKAVGKPVKCGEVLGKYLLSLVPFPIHRRLLVWELIGTKFWVEGLTREFEGNLWGCYLTDRHDFDRWLANNAKREGASLWLNAELIGLNLTEEGGINAVIRKNCKIVEVKPKVLIAADGSESTVLQLLDLYKPAYIVETLMWYVRNVNLNWPRFYQIYVGNFTRNLGYGVIIPKSYKTATICIGALGVKKESLMDSLEEFIELEPVKKQIKNCQFIEERSKKIVGGHATKEIVSKNVILTGDAADHALKPFFEGILPAVISGFFAGETAAKFCKGFAKLEEYPKRLRSYLYPYLEKSEKFNEFLCSQFRSGTKINTKSSYLLVGLLTDLFKIDELDKLTQLSCNDLTTILVENKWQEY